MGELSTLGLSGSNLNGSAFDNKLISTFLSYVIVWGLWVLPLTNQKPLRHKGKPSQRKLSWNNTVLRVKLLFYSSVRPLLNFNFRKAVLFGYPYRSLVIRYDREQANYRGRKTLAYTLINLDTFVVSRNELYTHTRSPLCPDHIDPGIFFVRVLWIICGL